MRIIYLNEDGSDNWFTVPVDNIDFAKSAGESFAKITLKSGAKSDVMEDIYTVTTLMAA